MIKYQDGKLKYKQPIRKALLFGKSTLSMKLIFQQNPNEENKFDTAARFKQQMKLEY